MKFILGKKQKMTQFFTDDGTAYPATIISAGPITITQLKTSDRDGYSAVQVGYEPQKESRVPKAQQGHTKDFGPFKHLREHRISPDEVNTLEVGSTVDVSSFEVGDTITVSGTSKSKGFQGVVKRHGFHGGPRTHGQKHSEREAGSIGATGPQRVFKGKRMPGRMGGDRVTLKNIEVLHVDPEENVLLVKGAVPGRPGSVLEINQ